MLKVWWWGPPIWGVVGVRYIAVLYCHTPLHLPLSGYTPGTIYRVPYVYQALFIGYRMFTWKRGPEVRTGKRGAYLLTAGMVTIFESVFLARLVLFYVHTPVDHIASCLQMCQRGALYSPSFYTVNGYGWLAAPLICFHIMSAFGCYPQRDKDTPTTEWANTSTLRSIQLVR